MKNQESSSDVETLAKEINGIRIAMLVTTNRQGHMHARPMATQEMEFDGTLWFFTRDVSYADPEGNRYVSIAGRASMVHDRAKMRDLWSPAVKAWFPDGVDDPKLALIRVDVISAQYWDFASRRLVQLAGFVKAVLTGQPLKTDQNNRKIDFSQH
jgi:general stress protein 26